MLQSNLNHEIENASDRRRESRAKVADVLQVKDAMKKETVGRLVDISRSGLMLLSTLPWKENQVYDFVLELPKHLSELSSVTIQAKNVWFQPVPGQDLFGAGFEIIETSENAGLLIDVLLLRYS